MHELDASDDDRGPRSADPAREAVPPLIEFGNVTLNPAHDGRVSQRQAAFGHYFHEIAKAELVSQISAHAQNDDLAVEMAAFEKFVRTQHQPLPQRPVPLSRIMSRSRRLHQNPALPFYALAA
ncbi:hypothetical protein A1351_18350 [Methylosinus sp. R-45379]|nr:hypothetical protein A1351_18350 [Methylosinus sp. R-45379]